MKKIQTIVKLINRLFTVLVLVLFYVFGIGLGRFIKLIFVRHKNTGSFWMPHVPDNDQLTSPY